MFNDKLREEYLDIKAPAELYERIMNSEVSQPKKNNVISFGKIVSLAAAFSVIILAGFIFSSGNKIPDIYMGAEKLTGEISLTEAENDGIMLARMGNEISCDLTFDLKTETAFVLSDGFLSDKDGNIILENETEGKFSEKFSCKWVVPMADESKAYEIKISDKNGTYLITLYFDIQADSWTVCMTK